MFGNRTSGSRGYGTVGQSGGGVKDDGVGIGSKEQELGITEYGVRGRGTAAAHLLSKFALADRLFTERPNAGPRQPG
jgi:hypothetical protein